MQPHHIICSGGERGIDRRQLGRLRRVKGVRIGTNGQTRAHPPDTHHWRGKGKREREVERVCSVNLGWQRSP